MKLTPVLVTVLGGATAEAAPDGAVVRVENSFELTIAAAYDQVAPLFGAWAERAWAGDDWKPEFLYPLPPRDEPGEVFWIAHGHQRAVWVNTAMDLKVGFIQYVYVIPDVQVAVIDIHLERRGPSGTHARVTYRRTALDPSANAQVTRLGVHDGQAGQEWEAAISAAVRAASTGRGGAPSHP